MSDSRREFLKKTAGIAASALPLLGSGSAEQVRAATKRLGAVPPSAVAADEDFWYSVRQAFNVSPRFINLENGSLSPQPEAGIDELCVSARMLNEIPSFYTRRRWGDDSQTVQHLMGQFAGCSTEELLITRNTTESLNIVIMGMPLQRGDEALFGDYEYGSMKFAFAQRAARDGIKNNILELPLTAMSDDEIVAAYKNALTPNTKVILVSHLVYLTGQILPVRAICDMAHERGVEVIVDGAHAFAHLAYKIPDLLGDYYAASLHKWMMAPLGTGLLYIKKDKIKKIWPLFGAANYDSDSIGKFGNIGTRPVYVQLALAEAIHFNEGLGLERKEARLRYLKNYWAEQLRAVPRITVHTPFESHRSCAIAVVSIEGREPGDVANVLYDKYKIFTVAPGYRNVVRIAPNIYSTTGELDRFVAAMKELAG